MGGAERAPSMLDLIRLSKRPLFPPGGRELCRQVALLTDLQEGQELLVVPSGLAVTVEYFVREHDVNGSGVEPDSLLHDRAEDRLRTAGLLERTNLQTGRVDQLPFRDEIFDVVVGELGLSANTDPADAVAELIRVTRPGGTVVLVQLSWRAPVEVTRRDALSERLGARPLTTAEWKELLVAGGLDQLHTEDWSDEETAFRPRVSKPFPDFEELFTLREKLGILRRAWGRWGWKGFWTALALEQEVHRLLTRERILGLDLVKATKPALPARPEAPAASHLRDSRGGATSTVPGPTSDEAGDEPRHASSHVARMMTDDEVEDLPLFSEAVEPTPVPDDTEEE